ncbi:MAG: hypothetical protein EGR36_09625 [Eubacterium ventriosum]|nr:hypothetical protein [Eubacterium ventriosum]
MWIFKWSCNINVQCYENETNCQHKNKKFKFVFEHKSLHNIMCIFLDYKI